MKVDNIDTAEMKECREFLISYNVWRRGGKVPMPNSRKIGMNIDKVIGVLNKILEGGE